MEQKQRFFIYDRKEIIVLVFLGLTVALFAFTLGVHLGKKVGHRTAQESAPSTRLAETGKDELPGRTELVDQMKHTEEAADTALNLQAHEEVARTGIKLDQPKQVALPEKPKSQEAGATTLGQHTEQVEDAMKDRAKKILARPAPLGRFTLQIGSYPTVKDALQKIDTLESVGMKPFLREVDLSDKGQWFRIYIGGYVSHDEAKQVGTQYQDQHVIDNFVVTKMPGH